MTATRPVQTAFVDELRNTVSGEVRTDDLARGLYATDASIYEITPDVVIMPRTVADVVAVVRLCARHGVPLTPRGAGTGLTGGAVNRGVQLDLSRYMNRVLAVDSEKRQVRVEPGVVLDELNAELKPLGLHFPLDVATSSRATIGGMIGNNSCGAHSIVLGRTCDHVLGLDVVLADGSRVHWGVDGADDGGGESEPVAPVCDQRPSPVESRRRTASGPVARRCAAALARVHAEYADEVAARFPKVFRHNGGYALDRLKCDNGRVNVEQVIIGSEGTLGVVVGATLNLVPLPKRQGLIVVHYADLLESLASVPELLEYKPSAVELVDKFILDQTKDNPAMARLRWFIEGDPAALLAVEFFAETDDELQQRLEEVAADLQRRRIGYAQPMIADPQRQADVWAVRKAGTGLLMSRPGPTQPYDFVDDAAVDPARLRDYIARLQKILVEEGIENVGYYAHASVGLLHVRPALNLRNGGDIRRLRRIGDRISSLVAEFGGAMSGEHGDGLVRSEWIPKLYGPKLVEAFRKVKTAFDPQGILNPGKIVDPLPMDANLRYGAGFESAVPQTVLDFSKHGGMAGLADMCSGIGQCRTRLVGTMCPSYMATGDERHTTRARGNALRLALSNKPLLDGLADEQLDEVFDLCLSCKACKTECPTGTDIAKLKTEWLHARNQRIGIPARSRLIAASVELAAWGSAFAPLANLMMQNPVSRAFMEHFFGLDRRVPPPKFASPTFRRWFAKRKKKALGGPRVVYFVDTWVNCYTPQVGGAAVKVLEALGHEVIVPPTVCCGRPLISKGMLDDAKRLAEANVAILAPFADEGLPIIGTEPSCVSVLTDELAQFVRTPAARRIGELALTIENFVGQRLKAQPDALKFKRGSRSVLYHGHCHQKSLTGTADAMRALTACSGDCASEINSGCCGMAGSFGHEVEHYDVAKAVGEQRLFPAVRSRGDAEIAISGFSCRHQIGHHTDAHPRHVIELVADALGGEVSG